MKAWATELGGYIVKNVCAGTPEEYLLKELWGVATPNERKVVASLIFKLVRCIAPLLIENLVLKERTGFLCKGRTSNGPYPRSKTWKVSRIGKQVDEEK